MICFLCGEELDARKAFDVKQGELLRPAHQLCAIQFEYAEMCEGCKKAFKAERLCTNEETRRKECSGCYELWRQGWKNA